LMVDTNQVLSLEKTARLARRLEDCHLDWFEEPLPKQDIESYVQLGPNEPRYPWLQVSVNSACRDSGGWLLLGLFLSSSPSCFAWAESPAGGGEAQASRDKYADLKSNEQIALQTSLNSLILFPPDDTASSLEPGDPTKPGFPQFGHGSIKLTVLSNDPTALSNSGVFARMPVYRGAQTSPLHSFSNSTARLDFLNHPPTNVAALLAPARRWLHARVIPALSAHH
jgi:hypothetical protein